MRKTYRLDLEGRPRERLVEASKHDIRKYFRRERRKPLPAGADVWDFDVRVGADPEHAEAVAHAELIHAVDALVAAGQPQFYVEILARPGQRRPRPAGENGETGDVAQD